MTLAEMIADVRSRIAEASDTFFTDADITNWLNAAQMDVAAKLPNDALMTLRAEATAESVAGTSCYPLPDDYLRWRGVVYGGKPCRMIGLEETHAIEGGNVFWQPSMDEPMAYVWGQLRLYPPPAEDNISIVFAYIKQPSAMSEATDECPLPAELHTAVVLHTCATAHAKDQNWEAMQAFLALYNAALSQYMPTQAAS